MESGGNVELGAYQDNNSGQTRISIHDCPLSKSTCKLLNRVVPNGTPDCLTISIHGIIRLQDIEIGGLIMAYIVGADRNQSRMITASLDDLIDKIIRFAQLMPMLIH